MAIFYYPWYGTASVDGAWQHWQQNGNDPPAVDRVELVPGAWRLLLVGRGDRACPDARDRVDRRSDRDRLVVGAGIGGGRSAAARRACCTRGRAARGVARRAVRGTDAGVARPRSCASCRQVGHHRRLRLRLDDGRRRRMEGRQQAAPGPAALCEHEPARQGRGGWLCGALHLRRADLQTESRSRACARRRACTTCSALPRSAPASIPSVRPETRASRVEPTARPTTGCGGARSALPPTSSRSRATTSGTRERRSSRPRPSAAPYASYDGAYGLTGRAAQRAYLDRTAAWVRAYREKMRAAAASSRAPLPAGGDTC